MEKISITKKDTVPHIVEKILESDEKEIALSIPSGSNLADPRADLVLIKREAEAAGKSISIESPDDKIVAIAEEAGILASYSLDEDGGSRPVVSDIVPSKAKNGLAARGLTKRDKTVPAQRKSPQTDSTLRQGSGQASPSAPSSGIRPEDSTPRGPRSSLQAEPDKVELVQAEESAFAKSFWEKAEKEHVTRKELIREMPPEPLSEVKAKKTGRPKLKMAIAFLSAVLAIALGGGWAVGAVWGSAEVSLSFKKAPWQYNGAIVAGKTFSEVDAAKNRLPAEIFKQTKNATRLFPASATAKVSQKATAKILIYNAYSSSKQTLVATTRFASPDGRIFRLDKAVVVPGAGIKDSKIVPSVIEAAVTADKPGVEYNVGPLDKMTLPGFQGTPRYDGFYAVMPAKASGGFVGDKKVPTASDIASAKEKTSQGLKDALQAIFSESMPSGFNIIDGASSVTVTRLTVNSATDNDGNFSIFGEASLQAAGFRDNDLKSLLSSLMSQDNPDMVLNDLKLSYENAKPDFASGQLSFSVGASGVIQPKFSENDLKSKIAGRPLNEARTLVVGLPELASAKVSLWPFWLKSLPKDVSKIKVVWN